MDRKIIDDFRDWINENDWTLFKYRDKDNRNQWNCICSAMDWIDVSVQYMSCHPLTAIREYQSIELFSYIASVDIIVEAVEQLYRVICSTEKQLFKNDRDCFPDNPFSQTDREYFKTIRACFGAHPVNLKDPEDPENKEAKRFASWSGGFFGPGNFSVFLYSNRINGENILLSIKYEQVERFAEKYYCSLPVLKKKLQQQYSKFLQQMRAEKFEYDGDVVRRLNILREQSKRRLNNDYYNHAIDELLRTFQTPITCADNLELVNQYLDFLNATVDEIHINLQNMTLVDLTNDVYMTPSGLPLRNGWGYWVEKLNSARLGLGYPQEIWLSAIENIFAGQFAFEFSDAQELYVLVRAALYNLSLKHDKQ